MDTTTYYGRSPIKPSPFEWKTAAYIFLGGVSGAAAIIGTMADLGGARDTKSVVRNARYLALPGITAGPVLLIAALHTPARFYNMLRIFRGTSPMSIGSYTLSGFGVVAGTTALAQMAEQAGLPGLGLWRRLASTLQIPAALLGAVMAAYTGGLLAATSNPLWSAAPRLLAARFGAASMAAAASALALLERRGKRRKSAGRLEDLAALAATLELLIGTASDRIYRAKGVNTVLDEAPLGPAYHVVAEMAGTMLPVGLHIGNALRRRRSGALGSTASVAILVGSAALRMTMLYAGNASAKRPLDYFAVTQPLSVDGATQ